MKKTILLLSILYCSIMAAQESSFGILGGYNLATQKVTTGNVNSGGTDTASGFLAGIFVDIGVSEKFKIRPELLYTNIKNQTTNSGASVNFLMLPVFGNYYFTDELSLLFGPQLNYSLSEEGSNIKELSFATSAGLSFDIVDNLLVQAVYSYGVSNIIELPGYDVKMHFLHFSLGYRF